jgi:DNA-binding NarL/FixJ family response regulator
VAGTPPEPRHVLTCVVADDHPAIVESVTRLLEAVGGFEVTGHAFDGAEALDRIRTLRPDVALVDLEMPQLSGIEITRRLIEEGDPPGVIIYSGHDDPVRALEALEAGARGFVVKSAPLDDLPVAVRVVAAGGTFVDPEIATVLSGPKSARLPLLTHREREVLGLLAEGMRNDEVAVSLAISPLTVRTHVRHAMEKLKAGTRTEAVAIALRQSLIL